MELLKLKTVPTINYFFEMFQEVKETTTDDIEDVKKYMKFMRTREENENSVNINGHLTVQWYKSLEENDLNPDYSVYADENYFKGVLACFLVYSKEYIKRSARVNKHTGISAVEFMKSITSNGNIVDLGNGIGYSTACLKELFPEYSVYGTNYKDSEQWKLNELIGKIHGYSLIEDHQELDSAEIIFASEYFEHIQNPIEHLEDIIKKLDPKVLIIANSFNKDEAGHFREYYHNGERIQEAKMSRIFNK